MPFTKFEMTLTLQPRFSAELHALTNGLELLTKDSTLLPRLLRQAVAETWLVAYRQKFLDDLPEAMTTERADGKAPSAAFGAAVEVAKEAMTKAAEALTDAQLGGRRTALAERRLTAADKAYREAIDHNNPSADPLPVGHFREQALELLRQMSETVMSTTGDPTVAMGYLPSLDAIKTPSATPALSEKSRGGTHDTTSVFNIFWEHLEFGTGALASGRGKSVRGPWRYGPASGGGLEIKGSPGVHALFDLKGVPYAADSFRFEAVFEAYFMQALHGQYAA